MKSAVPPADPKNRRWSTALVCAGGVLALGLGSFLPLPHVFENPAQEASKEENRIIVSPPAPTDAKLSWEDNWRRLATEAASPARNRKLGELLEELARTDPKRALALALAEENWLARDQLRAAALQGWGATAPDDAAAWAMSQPVLGERMFCVEAVLTGAAEHPNEAVRVALQLCTNDPVAAGDYGHTVINALVEKSGDFDAARRFATAATMVDRQTFLLDSAYYQWAQHQPDRALSELAAIQDPRIRSAAMKGVVAGFSDSNPQKLADYAQALPPGQDRSDILRVALPEWVGKDPAAALQWTSRVDPDPDFDKGISTLALLPTLIEKSPQVAMELTESICDSAQRTLTRSNVFFRWAQQDFTAARTYAEATQNVEYRESMMQDLAAVEAAREK
jgi:hypothetical protein